MFYGLCYIGLRLGFESTNNYLILLLYEPRSTLDSYFTLVNMEYS